MCKYVQNKSLYTPEFVNIYVGHIFIKNNNIFVISIHLNNQMLRLHSQTYSTVQCERTTQLLSFSLSSSQSL